MTKKATGKKTGRPLLDLDPKVVEGMASVGATDMEIADFLGCSDDTVRNRFSDLLSKTRAGLKTRLRQAQIKVALGGNPTMLIWMGKQLLAQADQQNIRIGDIEMLSDAELAALAAGKLPK